MQTFREEKAEGRIFEYVFEYLVKYIHEEMRDTVEYTCRYTWKRNKESAVKMFEYRFKYL